MPRRTTTVDDNIDSVSIPVAVDGMAEGSGDWSEKHNVDGALLRTREASGQDDLIRAVSRLEGDIAAHSSHLIDEAQGRNRRALGFALGGVLVGGLIGAAVVAALHARKR